MLSSYQAPHLPENVGYHLYSTVLFIHVLTIRRPAHGSNLHHQHFYLSRLASAPYHSISLWKKLLQLFQGVLGAETQQRRYALAAKTAKLPLPDTTWETPDTVAKPVKKKTGPTTRSDA